MAYNYIEESDIKDALHDSEEYMAPFFEPLAEIERVTRGRPGKVPQGKPKVTDGTLAAIRRESPKEVIQQLPTGIVTIKEGNESLLIGGETEDAQNPDFEQIVNGVLTDIILPHANSGGDPFTKAKQTIKDVIDSGGTWRYCFYNRTGDVFHGDYRRKYVKDVLFEQGKVSEYDTNYLLMVDYLTKGDIKAIMYWQNYLSDQAKGRNEKFESEWVIPALQKLLDKGAKPKDDASKSEIEKQKNNTGAYFKVVYALQKGVGGQFFVYSPDIDMTVRRFKNKDPRGAIPLLGWVPEPDFANPNGEPLAAISIGKQNLQDFNMQMFQYNMGIQNSPPVKLWGTTNKNKIKLVPDAIIQMKGTPATDDFKAVDIDNAAIEKFPANYGLIKSQIMNEMGANGDTSVSAESGNPSFSKTQAGVKAQVQRMGVNYNDLRKGYEIFEARTWETVLNIHFAESQGQKELDLESKTLKRLNITKKPKIDYSKNLGKICYEVDPSTSQADNNDAENQKLTTLLELKQKYGAVTDDKTMLTINQIIKNSGVDDPEKLMYTEDEIKLAKEITDRQRQQAIQQLSAPPQTAQPTTPPPPPKQPSETINYKDAPDDVKRQIEAQAGLHPSQLPPPIAVTAAAQNAGPTMPAVPPPSAIDKVLTDRQAAKHHLIAKGASPDQAEQALAVVDHQVAAS